MRPSFFTFFLNTQIQKVSFWSVARQWSQTTSLLHGKPAINMRGSWEFGVLCTFLRGERYKVQAWGRRGALPAAFTEESSEGSEGREKAHSLASRGLDAQTVHAKCLNLIWETPMENLDKARSHCVRCEVGWAWEKGDFLKHYPSLFTPPTHTLATIYK